MLDDVQDVSSRLIVKGYRGIAAQYGCAPTAKTTDAKIIEIYMLVTTAFHHAAKQRGEHIPASVGNHIVLKFFQVYEMMPRHFEGHLRYEVEKYLNEGLRDDYRQELELFDPDVNEPDVKRLRELHKLTRDKLQASELPQQTKRTEQRKPATPFPSTTICTKCSQGLRYMPRAEPFTIRCPQCKNEMVVNAPVKKPVLDDSTGRLSPEFPQAIIHFATEAASASLNTASLGGTLTFDKAIHYALIKETISYYSKIAISAVMIKRGWYGEDKYSQAEAEVFNAIRWNLARRQYRVNDFFDDTSRRITEAYFIKSIDGLSITEKQVYAFAETTSREQVLAELPDNQLDVFYYTMRIARLLEVHDKVDTVVAFYVSGTLVNHAVAFTDFIQRLVDEPCNQK